MFHVITNEMINDERDCEVIVDYKKASITIQHVFVPNSSSLMENFNL